MKVRVQSGDMSSVELEDARSAVVIDDHGQPIVLVQSMAPGQVLVARASDPNFRKQIEALGIGLRADFEVRKGHAS